MQRVETDGGSSTDARFVQVEIVLDDPYSMLHVLGREARVVFERSPVACACPARRHDSDCSNSRPGGVASLPSSTFVALPAAAAAVVVAAETPVAVSVDIGHHFVDDGAVHTILRSVASVARDIVSVLRVGTTASWEAILLSISGTPRLAIVARIAG
jgi:hypothetical protein